MPFTRLWRQEEGTNFFIILSVNQCMHEHQRPLSNCVHSEWVVYYLSGGKLTAKPGVHNGLLPIMSVPPFLSLLYLPPSNNIHLVITQRMFANDHHKPQNCPIKSQTW